MKPSIITLLTDFGSRDYFAGAMKGVILSINPSAQIVDITHDIPPQDIQAAAFNLLASYQEFPEGTIHVAVVDPGVGSARRALAIECGGRLYLGPDNGLFTWICERESPFRAIHLTNERFFRKSISPTFHGRDIFAPVAAALSKGIPLEEFGEEVGDMVRLLPLAPNDADKTRVEGRIIYIDRFGNCITNLTRDHLGEEFQGVLIVNGREISAFRRFFAEQQTGKDDLFGIFGSAGFLEIAARNSSAARILNARREQPVIVRPAGHNFGSATP